MEALELMRLGRRLTKLGEEGLRGPKGGPGGRGELAMGPALVMQDVVAHDGSTVSEIKARTGLPQSYVSESVARLRAEGVLVTETDPDDRRRTRVRMSRDHLKTVRQKGRATVDGLVLEAFGDVGTKEAARLLAALETIAERLRPAEPGPVVRLLEGTS